MKEFYQVQPDTSKTLTVLIGCKSDLEDQRQITSEEERLLQTTTKFHFSNVQQKQTIIYKR